LVALQIDTPRVITSDLATLQNQFDETPESKQEPGPKPRKSRAKPKPEPEMKEPVDDWFDTAHPSSDADTPMPKLAPEPEPPIIEPIEPPQAPPVKAPRKSRATPKKVLLEVPEEIEVLGDSSTPPIATLEEYQPPQEDVTSRRVLRVVGIGALVAAMGVVLYRLFLGGSPPSDDEEESKPEEPDLEAAHHTAPDT